MPSSSPLGITIPEEAEGPICERTGSKPPELGWGERTRSFLLPYVPPYTACRIPSRLPGLDKSKKVPLRKRSPDALKVSPTGLFIPPVMTTSSWLPSGLAR